MEAIDGYGLIRERTYRSSAYRIIEMHKAVYDSITQTWCGFSGQAWYVVDRNNFFQNFENAVEAARTRIAEE